MALRSLKAGAGYLEIDHRDSPGLTTADIAGIPGALAVGPGEHFETDIKRCAHCDRGVILHPQRERPRGYCAKCDHYICDDPICATTCDPVRRLFEDTQNFVERTAGRDIDPASAPRILITDTWKE